MTGQRAPERMIGLLESELPQLNPVGTEEFMDLEIVMDSGACEHVVDAAMTPGYCVEESPESKAGACFVAANGERMPNKGEVKLQLKSGVHPITSTFQVSTISKPLWSVGKICDSGYEVRFTKDGAHVLHPGSGKQVGQFSRKRGLYMGTLQLKNPAAPTFTRQGH